jgi:hypothetical protein
MLLLHGWPLPLCLCALCQELVDDDNAMVSKYSAGALKNLMAALAEAGFDADASAPIVGAHALDKVAERAKWAAVQRITERSAANKLQRAVSSQPKRLSIPAPSPISRLLAPSPFGC